MEQGWFESDTPDQMQGQKQKDANFNYLSMNEIINVSQSTMLEALNRSEVDMQIATAKAYPRDVKAALQRIREIAMLDKSTATDCFYKLNRSGKDIDGLSIRMTEIIAGCWGNLRVQSRIIGNDGKTITAQAVCHDLESNLAVSVEVKRRITDKSGKTYSEDMQVMTGNAACAIAFRNAVLKVVPKAVTLSAVTDIQNFIKGEFKKETPDVKAKRKAEVLDWYHACGVTDDELMFYLRINSMDEINDEKMMELEGLGNAIGEGSTSIRDALKQPFSEAKAGEQAKAKSENNKKRAEEAIARATDKLYKVFILDDKTQQSEKNK